MRISDIFQDHMTFSFEVFPPKTDQPVEPLLETLDKLYAFRPDFISCTYGAGGTNKGRNAEVVNAIQKSGRTEALSHFTCIGNTREDVDRSIRNYLDMGVENVLALRGDLPPDWTGTRGDFAYANEMIAYLTARAPQLCIGAACYMEKHIDAPSFAADIAHLHVKQDNGAAFLMTQLCHDVTAYARFLECIRKAGITLPVVVGIMPVLGKEGVIRMAVSNGCSIPRELAAIIGKYGNSPEDFKKAGKAYTVEQIYRYIGEGISGIHIYTMNKYQDVTDIVEMSGIRSGV